MPDNVKPGTPDVELIIHIGADTTDDVRSILMREALAKAKRMLVKAPQGVLSKEKQRCSGAMRVTLRRPDMMAAELQTRFDNAKGCRSGRDGECDWAKCPQNNPATRKSHCPLDTSVADES